MIRLLILLFSLLLMCGMIILAIGLIIRLTRGARGRGLVAPLVLLFAGLLLVVFLAPNRPGRFAAVWPELVSRSTGKVQKTPSPPEVVRPPRPRPVPPPEPPSHLVAEFEDEHMSLLAEGDELTLSAAALLREQHESDQDLPCEDDGPFAETAADLPLGQHVVMTVRHGGRSTARALRNMLGPPLRAGQHRRIVTFLLGAVAIGTFLYIAYLFLDAATLGYFSWRLRFLCLAAFVVLYAALTVWK